MKKIGVILLVIVIFIALAVGLAFWATRDLPVAADAFFSLIRQGQAQEAYLQTASEFRAATSEAAFMEFLRATGFADYQSASWSSRSIDNNTGTLEGTVTTASGGQIPVVLTLVKEAGTWKVLSLRKAQAGLVREKAQPEVPPDSDAQRLTADAMSLLADAIARNDFKAFHAQVSELWQAQTTPEQLQVAFASFVEKNIDLTPLRTEIPVFNQKPVVDEDGVLLLEGYYPTPPQQVFFKMKFIYEHPQWKLMGINVRL